MTRRIAEPREAELWLVDLAAAALALEALECETPRLSSVDEQRLAATADVSARRERRASHIALRLCLERIAGPAARGVPYTFSSSGKPWLAGTGVSFSLSHIPGRALIGVTTRGEIGVDLERSRSVRITGERRQAIERAGIELAGGLALPEAHEARFLTAWVRLEAIAKAEGSGVGAHLSVFLGRRQKLPPPRLSGGQQRALGPLIARDLDVASGFYAAVALPKTIETPSLAPLPDFASALSALVP
ncbi:MAG: hypothetical protein WC807_08715 [Hyphomicrobium sp.]|jgi:4'-phosphopantetheinyl transferase